MISVFFFLFLNLHRRKTKRDCRQLWTIFHLWKASLKSVRLYFAGNYINRLSFKYRLYTPFIKVHSLEIHESFKPINVKSMGIGSTPKRNTQFPCCFSFAGRSVYFTPVFSHTKCVEGGSLSNPSVEFSRTVGRWVKYACRCTITVLESYFFYVRTKHRRYGKVRQSIWKEKLVLSCAVGYDVTLKYNII